MPKSTNSVLVIDDEPQIRRFVGAGLELHGYTVKEADTGAVGLSTAAHMQPDVIVLDLGLPDMSGIEVLESVRAWSNVPIIVLSIESAEEQKVMLLKLGADDYIVKPFSIRELLLRVQAVLRRQLSERSPTPMLRFGNLRVDRDAHRAWVNEEPLDLTALEFRLLVTLCDRRDRVQPRATLLRDVWQIDGDIPTRTVDTHVKRLREKLGACARCIETVRGVGYRFTATPDMSGSGAFEEVDEA